MSETYQGSQLSCEEQKCRLFDFPVIDGKVYREIPVLSYTCYEDVDDYNSGEKRTLQYIQNNYSKLVDFLVKNKKLDRDTAYGLVSEAFIEFKDKPDFEFQVSERGEVISLGTYIRYMLKQLVKRKFSGDKKIYDNECSNIHGSSTNSDDLEEDWYNTIPDERSNISIDIDIESALKSCRHLRYSCGGADIFEFLYIMVMYAMGGKKNALNSDVYSRYKILLKARGMSDSDAATIEEQIRKSENIKELIKQVAEAEQNERLDDIEKSLSKYVYGVKQIREILALA